jgi:hypothetical protein
MSLVPKVDELREFLLRYEIRLAFITETLFKGLIQDSVVTIPGYTTFRRDIGEKIITVGYVLTLIIT